MGPSRAPKNPPFCTIRFFVFNDVFLSESFFRSLFLFNKARFCDGVNAMLPQRMFLLHSQRHFTNSCCVPYFFNKAFFLAAGARCSCCSKLAYFLMRADMMTNKSRSRMN